MPYELTPEEPPTANRKVRFPASFAASMAMALLLVTAGCHTTVDDATLTSNVKSALANDPAIKQQPIQVSVQNGTVTLSGNVSDDTASTVAAEDAARVKGVRQVVTSMTIAGVQVAPTITSPAAPTTPRQTTPQEQQAIASNQPLPPPPAHYTPPAPVVREVTVPAGTAIPVRITQAMDSAVTQEGTPFSGVVTREVEANGMVVIPAGSGVSGRVVAAKDAGHFKGHSLLSLEVTAINRHGHSIPLHTEPYTVEGKNRGTNSAEKIGGGAAVGAILGGIFGGGKGAAIGAAAGGGGGAAYQGLTRGQQVRIGSEEVVRFRLAAPFTVQTSETPTHFEPRETGEPTLHTR